MHLKGTLAVIVFVSSIVASGASTAVPADFTWSHGPVVDGGSVEVKIEAAPCHPVTVTLQVAGQTISRSVAAVPGSVFLPVPDHSSGQGYTITVSCPDARSSQSGQVL